MKKRLSSGKEQTWSQIYIKYTKFSLERHGGGGVKPSIVPNIFTTGTVLDVRGGRRGTDDKGVAKLDKG